MTRIACSGDLCRYATVERQIPFSLDAAKSIQQTKNRSVLKALLSSSIQTIWQLLEIHAAVSQSKKGQRKKSTYTGAHVSDHISRDHWAIFKLQLRRKREICFSDDPSWQSEITWQIQMHSIPTLQTEEDCSGGCWGTSIHRVNPLGTAAKSSWQIWHQQPGDPSMTVL